mmetsp:Transcript_7337/g.18473  ORF Transcript_7337/g.18473 Transcript_7337/m.18473 type:complete len:454 (+) Transcript_7337:80-1441(+)
MPEVAFPPIDESCSRGYTKVPTGDYVVQFENEEDCDEDLSFSKDCRQYIKLILEDPSSSTAASVVQYAMILLITSSVSAAIMETVPSWRGSIVFQVVEPIFIVCFTMEILLRLWTCVSYKLFFTSTFNIIDILATLPCYFDLLLTKNLMNAGFLESDFAEHFSDPFQALRLADVVQVVRLLRILRVANTMRQSEMILIVLRSVRGSMAGIWVLMTFMSVGMITSATLAYCVEMSDPNSGFVSIPVSIWWAAATITAVGYGDLLPRTGAGKTVAVFTMFLGVVIMAVCIAVVAHSFAIQFERELYASRIRGVHRKLSKDEIVTAAECANDGQPRFTRQLSSSQVAKTMLKQRSWDASAGSSGDGTDLFEQDFSGMVREVEAVADAILLGLESLIDGTIVLQSDANARGPRTRCSRLALQMLKGRNKLWLQQARTFSEGLLRMSEGTVMAIQGRS